MTHNGDSSRSTVTVDIDLLQNIVEEGPLAIVATDNDGRILFTNQSALSNFGVAREQAMKMSLDSFFGEVDVWRTVRSELVAGMQVRESVRLESKTGKDFDSRILAFGVVEEQGVPQVFVFLIEDETSEMQEAEEQARKNVEMAKVNSELIRSNTELRRLGELKSSFLSIASHELKTPLTSIKGYSDIIMDTMRDRVDPSVLRMVENINRAANRLHKVVNNILDVTRIEQKRLRLQPERVDIKELAEEAVEELADMNASRRISFDCAFADGLPMFYGDKVRMQQVFVNLFSNAAKFSPDDSVIKVEIKLENPETFHIYVRDRGIGIDKVDQKRIFDPFYEVGVATRHSTHSSRYLGGGTGLGLSIVRGIVEYHGGKIWVESRGTIEGEFPGSVFHVILPVKTLIEKGRADEDRLLNVVADDSMDPDDTLAIVEEKPKVLLIDSDRESGDAARMVLESVFDVITAHSGEQGLSLAFQERPSLVILESNLPGLDGYRVCRILRGQDETRDTPVAFLSASIAEEEIHECFASGADDFIVKPFTKNELMDKIWRILMKKKEDAQFRNG